MIKISSGFTLIETLVAISFLTLAVMAPMSLASQSLAGAYYARDQVTAFNLAQEAIEAVRSARDASILATAFGNPTDILGVIPEDVPFVIDTRDNTMTTCSGDCPPMQTDGEFYAYGPVGTIDVYGTYDGWVPTRFTREVTATYTNEPDEIKISSTVTWRTGKFQERTFTLTESLYRWLDDGAAAGYSEASYYSEGTYVPAYSEGGYSPQGSNQICHTMLGWVLPPGCPEGEQCTASNVLLSDTGRCVRI